MGYSRYIEHFEFLNGVQLLKLNNKKFAKKFPAIEAYEREDIMMKIRDLQFKSPEPMICIVMPTFDKNTESIERDDFQAV